MDRNNRINTARQQGAGAGTNTAGLLMDIQHLE